jgi:hypothetical protein
LQVKGRSPNVTLALFLFRNMGPSRMTNKHCLDPLASGMIWRQARHLSRLTADLQDISRVARHQINLKTPRAGSKAKAQVTAAYLPCAFRYLFVRQGITMKTSGPEDAGLRAKQALNRFNKRKFALHSVQRTRKTKRIVQFLLVVAVGAMGILSAD